MEPEKKNDFFSIILAFLSDFFRSYIKGFLRLTTRLCELQRICYGEPAGAPRTLAIETSMAKSKIFGIKLVMDELHEKMSYNNCSDKDFDTAVANICILKDVKPSLHPQFLSSIKLCMMQICSYKRLVRTTEMLRSEAFDSENLEHEEQLIKLWNLLQPGVTLKERKSKDWQIIGFQGDDPKTDFRGMGILGLKNLLYFAENFEKAAKYLLTRSHHPKHGYSFAIVGINLTHMAYKLVKEGEAKTHMFNISSNTRHMGELNINHFHHFYSFLFVEFDKFWMEMKPENIMAFNRIRDLFESRIRDELKTPTVQFKVRLSVDNV